MERSNTKDCTGDEVERLRSYHARGRLKTASAFIPYPRNLPTMQACNAARLCWAGRGRSGDVVCLRPNLPVAPQKPAAAASLKGNGEAILVSRPTTRTLLATTPSPRIRALSPPLHTPRRYILTPVPNTLTPPSTHFPASYFSPSAHTPEALQDTEGGG